MENEVRASLGRVRISARKARLVCDAVRGKRVVDAQAMLRFMPQKTAYEMEKLMKSLVANAENNQDLDPEDLAGLSESTCDLLVVFRGRGIPRRMVVCHDNG